MNDPEPRFPDTRPMRDSRQRAANAADARASTHYRRRPPPPLSPAAKQALAEMRRGGIDAAPIAARFPHVLNRLAERWDAPIDMLQLIGDLLVDRRGGRQGFPEEVLALIVALQRHTVRRVVVAAGLPPPRGAGLSPGTCTPSSPS